MASIQEMREVCQLGRWTPDGKWVRSGHWFNRLIGRRISIYFTWCFLRIGLPLNAVTLGWIVTGVASVVLCVPHVLWLNLLGVFLVPLTLILDCCDGEMARWTKQGSLRGMYLDLMGHMIYRPALSAVCGLHLFVWLGDTQYLILAMITYVAALWRLGLRHAFVRIRLVHMLESSSPGEETTPETPKTPKTRGPLVRAVRRIGFAILQLPMDAVRLITAFLVAVLFGYAGYSAPLIYLTWFLAVMSVVYVVYENVTRYFHQVPNVAHVKKLDQH